MKKIYFDIETLPAPESKQEILKKIHENKKKKKTKYSQKYQEFFEKTTFDGAFGRIFCIAYAINDEEIKALVGDEKEILKKFWDLAKDANLFIGHNILEFDLPFIMQRSIILQVKPSRDISLRKYSNNPVFDTMHEWTKWSFGKNCSMDYLAHAMGLQTSKDELDGSQVYSYYQKGKYDDIVKYCKKDVKLNREIYKRIAFEY